MAGQQEFHAGLVKPRETRATTRSSIACIRPKPLASRRTADASTRVVLDYELKRDYQTFLNRPDRPADADRDDESRTFAAAHGLPVVDGHLELPDLRIEYETADGRLEYRDVELVTEHYSRGQLAGKAQAGFALYRAAGAGRAPRRQCPDGRHAVRSAPPGVAVMTFDERVQALEPLGFTPRQTRFLVTVALHSGYCLRRQYSAFAGVALRQECPRLSRRARRPQLAERFTLSSGSRARLSPARARRSTGRSGRTTTATGARRAPR